MKRAITAPTHSPVSLALSGETGSFYITKNVGIADLVHGTWLGGVTTINANARRLVPKLQRVTFGIQKQRIYFRQNAKSFLAQGCQFLAVSSTELPAWWWKTPMLEKFPGSS
jgi:hypothetical protein